ncbi:hypothetical protein BGW42_005312 [Actinomortierella wolfii]|nr:hypothetical protein BGW42_005312 [Actinomortierella wolfii]
MQPKQNSLVLEKFLGVGGFGEVHVARWGCQECAAKKFFNTHSDLDEKKIQKEVNVLQRLRHSNIVQFYGMHRVDNHIYLIMELAERGTLTQAINKGLLDWLDKTRLAHEIARGLEYIHQEGILHRDLKSANVLLTRNMEAKLADFGLAKIRSTVSGNLSMSSAGGRITGTLGWIAPELFYKNKPPYSTKSDVYALGMIMWEMAANCTWPYKDQNNGGLIAVHVTKGGRERLPNNTPPKYREWVERCWHHDPNQRPHASEIVIVRGRKKIFGNYDDAGYISATAVDGEITHVDTVGKPIGENHFNKKTAFRHLPQTDDDVVRYFCEEAQQDNGDAHLFLGWIYSHGGGVLKKNEEASAWWYCKATE